MISDIGGLDPQQRYFYCTVVNPNGDAFLWQVAVSSMRIMQKSSLNLEADPEGYEIIGYDDHFLFLRYIAADLSDTLAQVDLSAMQVISVVTLSGQAALITYKEDIVAVPNDPFRSLFMIYTRKHSFNDENPVYGIAQYSVHDMQFVQHKDVDRSLVDLFSVNSLISPLLPSPRSRYMVSHGSPFGRVPPPSTSGVFVTATVADAPSALLLLQVDLSSLEGLFPVMLLPNTDASSGLSPCAMDDNTLTYCLKNLTCMLVDLATHAITALDLPFPEQSLQEITCSRDYLYVSLDDFPNSPSYLLRIPRAQFSRGGIESIECWSGDQSAPLGLVSLKEPHFSGVREVVLAHYGYLTSYLIKAGTENGDPLVKQKSLVWKFAP